MKLLALFFLFSWPLCGQAQVRLSELAWAGSSASDADEWVELVNTGPEAVSLGGMTVRGVLSGGAALTLPDVVLEAGRTFLISNYALGDPKTVLAVAPDLVSSAVSLSNSALQVELLAADGTVMERVDGAVAGHAGAVRASMQRVGDAWVTTANAQGLLPGVPDLGTPGIVLGASEEAAIEASEPMQHETLLESTETTQETKIAETIASSTPAAEVPPDEILPEPAVTAYQPLEILINEFVSDPEQGDEWIELKSQLAETRDLHGYWITDASGTKTMLSGELTPYAYLVISKPKGALNNSGDTITLSAPTGMVIDSVTYGDTGAVAAPVKGQSAARGNSDLVLVEPFRITTALTPAGKNILQPPVQANAPPASSPAAAQQAMSSPKPKQLPFELFIDGPHTVYVGQYIHLHAASVFPSSETIRWRWTIDGAPYGNDADLSLPAEQAGKLKLTVHGVLGERTAQASITVAVRPLGSARTAVAAIALGTTGETDPPLTKTKTKKTSTTSGTPKSLAVGITATASTGLGVGGAKSFFLTDGTKVTVRGNVTDAITPGAVLQLRGTVKESSGQKTLSVDGAAVTVLRTETAPLASEATIEAMTDEYLGHLLEFQGVLGKQNSAWRLEQGDARLALTLPAGYTAGALGLEAGATVRVLGILQRGTSGWKLLLRDRSDVITLAQAPTATLQGKERKLGELGTVLFYGALVTLLGFLLISLSKQLYASFSLRRASTRITGSPSTP